MSAFHIRFWGTRGSIPTPGPDTLKYGGNTSCVEVRTPDGQLVILDCGSGMRALGMALADSGTPVEGHILLSHTHWDHIQGFPFFAPAFNRENRFTLYAARLHDRSLEEILALQMEYSYFPVKLKNMGAAIAFRELDEKGFDLGNLSVQALYLNHTSLTLGYRIAFEGRSVVYCTDVEPGTLPLWKEDLLLPSGVPRSSALGRGIVHHEDMRLVRFCSGADILIMDSQYTDEEYRLKKKTGWGHSTAQFATKVALAADVKRLYLYHHDPSHSDEEIDESVRAARALAKGFPLVIEGAREGKGLTLKLPGGARGK